MRPGSLSPPGEARGYRSHDIGFGHYNERRLGRRSLRKRLRGAQDIRAARTADAIAIFTGSGFLVVVHGQRMRGA
jgi:hypothetical protein